LKRFLLAIDVGNTATSFGLISVDQAARAKISVQSRWTVGTAQLLKSSFSNQLRKKLKKLSQRGLVVIDAIVSSVVPSVDRHLTRSVQLSLGLSPRFVTGRTSSKVKIRYRRPSEVGADRIVNARAAMALKKGSAIIVDFGTATTFDCVTARGEYLGGVITPGPVISAQALLEKTAKLPLVVLDKPAKILGRNTLESIQSGLYYGYRGLVKEIVRHLKKKLGKGTFVFATGGQARWILKGLGLIDAYEPDLTLIGLYHVWYDFSRRS